MEKIQHISLSTIMVISLLMISVINGRTQSLVQGADHELLKIQKQYGLNPNVPLTGRIRKTSPEILQKFRDAGMSPIQHQLSEEDSLKIVSAFKALPSLHQKILKDHLLGISFLDNMPNTALTATVNPDDKYPVFTITFRAEILKQNVTEWLTEKEMSYYNKGQSSLRLTVEGGNLNAILYVLMHEATHVVDGSMAIMGASDQKKTSDVSSTLAKFKEGVWLDRTTIVAKYRDSLSDKIRFRGGEKPSIALAPGIYQSARVKPFVSVYSTSSWHEDLAEYLTVSHFTEKLKQPFRIVIYDQDREIFSYEPMRNSRQKSRYWLMRHFYKEKS